MAAAAAELFDLEDDGVLVAVETDILHNLVFAGGLALVPDFLATAAVINGFAEGDGHLQALSVHVGEHEGLVRFVIERHRGDQAMLVKAGSEGKALLDGGFGFSGGKLKLAGVEGHDRR